VWCSRARNTKIHRHVPFTFVGHYRFVFARLARLFTQTGILKMYEDISNHIIFRKLSWNAKKLQSMDNEPTPFQISDMKIGSIFLIWISLAGLSSVAFLTELLTVGCHTRFKHYYLIIRSINARQLCVQTHSKFIVISRRITNSLDFSV